MKVIMKCVNIKLWDILSCFHYILNAPRSLILLLQIFLKENKNFRKMFIVTEYAALIPIGSININEVWASHFWGEAYRRKKIPVDHY